MEGKEHILKGAMRGWSSGHTGYTCVDGIVLDLGVQVIAVCGEACRGSSKGEKPESSPHVANGIEVREYYESGRRACRAIVSKVAMSRSQDGILKCFGETVTIVFPKAIRSVGSATFQNTKSLRAVMVNEGLEVLGADGEVDDRGTCGVFRKSAVQKVSLPPTLKRIGHNAFDCCKNLKSVSLPSGLEEIGKACFRKCGLDTIAIPDGVAEIHESAFQECSSLKSVVLGNESKLTKIGLGAFIGAGLEEFVAPPALKTISQAAFGKCGKLRRIALNEGLEVLGTDERPNSREYYCGVFSDSAVEEVLLPSTLKRIGYYVFANCKGLKRIVLPEGLERLEKKCFVQSGIEEIAIPDSIIEIPEYAFQGCANLKVVILGVNSRLEAVGLGAFLESGLKCFTAPPSLRTISPIAFYRCAQLRQVTLNEGLEVLGAGQHLRGSERYYGVFQNSAVESISFPSTLKRIEHDTFYGCKNLKGVALPECLEWIGMRCFQESGLEAIEVPDCVEEIQESAFNGCKSLKSVTLGQNSRLTRIWRDAFFGTSLESFIAPSSLRTLAQGAFCKCTQLKRVVLNKGLEALGTDECPDDDKRYYGVFERNAVETVELPVTLRRIEYDTFLCCSRLKQLNLPNGLEKIRANCFADSGLESVTIPNSVSKIGRYAFYKCAQLKSVAFEEGSKLEKIGDYVFYGTALESFVAPATLKEIGAVTFCDCESLKHIELNEGLESVGWLCFSATPLGELTLPERVAASGIDLGLECDYRTIWILENQKEIASQCKEHIDTEVLIIPASVTVIRAQAFAGLRGLRKVIFMPDSQLKRIEKESFMDCGIEEIELPKGLMEIGAEAFSGCGNLRRIYCQKGSALRIVGKRAFADTPLGPEDVEFPEDVDVLGAFELKEIVE